MSERGSSGSATRYAQDGGLIDMNLAVQSDLSEHNKGKPSDPEDPTITTKLVLALRDFLVQQTPTLRNSLEMKFALQLLVVDFHKLGTKGEVKKQIWLDAIDETINPPGQGHAPVRLGTGEIISKAITDSAWDATVSSPDKRSADTITRAVYRAISTLLRKLNEEQLKLRASGVDLCLYDVEEMHSDDESNDETPNKVTDSERIPTTGKRELTKKKETQSPKGRRFWDDTERLAFLKLYRESPYRGWEELAQRHSKLFFPEGDIERNAHGVNLKWFKLTLKGTKDVKFVITELERELNQKKTRLMTLVMPKSKFRDWMKDPNDVR